MIAPYIPRKFRNGQTFKLDDGQKMPLLEFLNQKRRISDKQSRTKIKAEAPLEIK